MKKWKINDSFLMTITFQNNSVDDAQTLTTNSVFHFKLKVLNKS